MSSHLFVRSNLHNIPDGMTIAVCCSDLAQCLSHCRLGRSSEIPCCFSPISSCVMGTRSRNNPRVLLYWPQDTDNIGHVPLKLRFNSSPWNLRISRSSSIIISSALLRLSSGFFSLCSPKSFPIFQCRETFLFWLNLGHYIRHCHTGCRDLHRWQTPLG